MDELCAALADQVPGVRAPRTGPNRSLQQATGAGTGCGFDDPQLVGRPGHRHVGETPLLGGVSPVVGQQALREAGHVHERPFEAFRPVDGHQLDSLRIRLRP